MKSFKDILIEGKGKIEQDELVPGFGFFVLSKDGRTVSKFKITGEEELNVGAVLNVKQTHISGDKVKQNQISKEFVLGTKGDIKVFRTKKEAISAFKKAGLLREAEKGDFIEFRRGAWYIFDKFQNIIGGPFKSEAAAKKDLARG